jgi:hypothetical protein
MKMKVGDIEMDSEDGIQIDGEEMTEGRAEERSDANLPAETRHSHRPAESTRRGVEEESKPPIHPAYELGDVRLPRHPPAAYLGVALGVLLATGGVALLWLVGSLPTVGLLLLPGLVTMGVGGLGGALHLRRSGLEWLEAPEEARREAERTERIVDVLEEADAPLTVEELRERLEWGEQETVSALRRAVENGRVLEDLDIEGDHWTYEPASNDALNDDEVRAALPIEERDARLES